MASHNTDVTTSGASEKVLGNTGGVIGHLHPLTHTVREIVGIFVELGFAVAQGPELEDEFHNFNALNIPKDHPARDMQDTFWLKESRATHHVTSAPERNATAPSERHELEALSQKLLLRTHTSSVQVRYMETHKPPFRIVVPGKVFRNEATDATHEAQFFQIEGLLVDETASLAQLKGVLVHFIERYFGKGIEYRFRPSFFSFVEPGMEVDIKRNGKWMEMLGAGMVHPNVLRAVNIDPTKYRGFAFGMGVDRFVLAKHGIDDIRFLYDGDLRLVNQF
jgi:phenylalanyl-tRNA synthetase alpha chain